MSSLDYKELKDTYNCDYFLETGYYMGSGVKRALDAGFKNIMSIEISTKHINYGKEHNKNEIELGILNLIQDDSKNIYNHIKNIDKKFLFFLDSHADQDLTHERGEFICPVLQELKEINKHHRKDHIILVDDMRIFRDRRDWAYNIVLDDVINEIKKINKNYEIKYLDGFQKNDVLCAYI
jgi:hypothetical protein